MPYADPERRRANANERSRRHRSKIHAERYGVGAGNMRASEPGGAAPGAPPVSPRRKTAAGPADDWRSDAQRAEFARTCEVEQYVVADDAA